MNRRTTTTAAAGALALLATGAALAPAQADDGAVRAAGELVRYDTTLVPAGATARVTAVERGDGSTRVKLEVRGLLPDRDYGAHVHVNPCGASGADAGGHYQFVRDPVQPSTDPAFANPDNEFWLDLTTDHNGSGKARAVVDWQTPQDRPAGSVVLHAEHTRTGHGEAGVAGARLACISVSF